jgi:MoaA/NifB/PqqE/SkfB family radical SAM enzyme
MLGDFLDHLTLPQLDWVQVEVSSHCNALCAYCPRTVHRRAWRNRTMPLRDFERLAPAFAKAGMVHLQGWGEPFLNPEILAMIRLARKAGCAVGTTTNGTLLDDRLIGELVASGIDMLAVSLAGIDERNDAIRQGARLQQVLDALRRLDEAKAFARSSTPALHVAHLLLRSRLADIEGFADFYAPLPVSQVVVCTLDFVPCPELADEVIAPATADEYGALRWRLDAAKEALRAHGKELHYRLRQPGATLGPCTENVGRSLFVSVTGAVSPCVFTNLPLAVQPLPNETAAAPYCHCSFGNIHDASVGRIWRSGDYRAFRAAFRAGRVPAGCVDCPKAVAA